MLDKYHQPASSLAVVMAKVYLLNSRRRQPVSRQKYKSCSIEFCVANPADLRRALRVSDNKQLCRKSFAVYTTQPGDSAYFPK